MESGQSFINNVATGDRVRLRGSGDTYMFDVEVPKDNEEGFSEWG